MLYLYNSLTKKKKEFIELKKGKIGLYTCGPTVYNYAHIGNLRSFLFYDILRRVLENNGYEVTHIMNITDVGHLTDDGDAGEDKMEKGATREGKNAWEIASFYTDAFLEDSEELNLLSPSKRPKATNHIQEQIDLIIKLEKNGLTYKTSDGIYFNTAAFPNYGKMAQLDIEGLEEGARVEKNNEKKKHTDFALWKFSPKGTQRAMEWESPWGIGFPGWHIECSAMAQKYLGETIDIHTGGVDHIQVHHTNEIAQSEGATGKPFARWWMHGEFLLINKGRMGKSLGNFITLKNLKEKGVTPIAYRLFVLGAHYRSKLNFTWENVKKAQKTYDKLIYTVSQWPDPTKTDETFMATFTEAINDDLSMPEAMAIFWSVIKSDLNNSTKAGTIFEMDKILGLRIREKAEELRMRIQEAGALMDEKLAEREKARQKKDYKTADRIRNDITEAGFIIEDTEEGAIIKPVDNSKTNG